MSQINAAMLTPDAFGLPPLTEPQKRFIQAPMPECLFLAGYGAGKTHTGLYWALLQAHHPANAGRTVGLLVPKYQLAVQVHIPRIESMCDALTKNLGWRCLRSFRKSELIFIFQTGARIAVLSYGNDANRIAGFEYCSALIDEPDANLGGDVAYRLAQTRVRGAGTGQIRVTTTPHGYQGVTRLYAEGRQDPARRHNFGIVRAPSESNPMTAPRVPAWRANMSKSDARRLLDAIVEQPGDAVYTEFDPQRHFTQWWPSRGWPWFASVDWGHSHAHVIYGARNPDGHIVLLGEWGEEQTTTHATVKALLEIQKVHFGGQPPSEIYPDRADMPSLRPEDRGVNILRREFPRSRIRTPTTQDQHAIWPKVQLVKKLLDPADGSEPALYFHSRLRHESATPDGTGIVEAISELRRRKLGGVAVDEIAANQIKLEHAVECMHYLVWGAEGGFNGAMFRITAGV